MGGTLPLLLAGPFAAVISGVAGIAVAGMGGEAILAARGAAFASFARMGDANGLGDDAGYVILAHVWDRGPQIFSFNTEEAARQVFERGGDLRRIRLRLTGDKHVTIHNRSCPWREEDFAGTNPLVDDAMRDFLLAELERRAEVAQEHLAGAN